jgi:PAS domain S-box-containing protein
MPDGRRRVVSDEADDLHSAVAGGNTEDVQKCLGAAMNRPRDSSFDDAPTLESALLETIERTPAPVQLYRRDGTLVLENEAFRTQFRAVGGCDLALATQAGRRSAFDAAVLGHSRAVPLGMFEGKRLAAVFAPLRGASEDEVRHVIVTYVTYPATELKERAEHCAPTLYGTEQSSLVETQLRFIVDNVPQLIWSSLPDGFVDFYNRRWLEYIGRSFEEWKGAGWNDFLHPDDQQRAWDAWQHALNTGEPYYVDYRFRRHDGQYRWFLGRAVPMRDAEGRIVRWFGSSTDIDDQKQGERERDDALSELERVTRLKDEFLATASHELRTPLNAILGWARMQRLDPALSGRAMAIIERNAAALADLINDLLDTSRIVANKMAIDRQPMDFCQLIRASLENLRPAIDAKGLTLHTEIDESIGPMVGDSNRLQQVITNIVANAAKFTPRGGTISLVAEKRGSNVRVCVSDTGKGIDPDFLPYVFDPFRQADGSQSRRDGGLGLGLSIAAHLVRLHGGEIKAESAGANRGSTFTLTIPVVVAPSVVEEEPIPETNGGAGLEDVQVLVVDDQIDARELLCEVLSRAGATVDAAESVNVALRVVREHPPDIILSDIGMPEQTGYDLIGELRSRGFQRPVIALTAFATSQDRARALRAGFNDHVAKPVEPAALVRTLARLLGRRGRRPPPTNSALSQGQHGARG